MRCVSPQSSQIRGHRSEPRELLVHYRYDVSVPTCVPILSLSTTRTAPRPILSSSNVPYRMFALHPIVFRPPFASLVCISRLFRWCSDHDLYVKCVVKADGSAHDDHCGTILWGNFGVYFGDGLDCKCRDVTGTMLRLERHVASSCRRSCQWSSSKCCFFREVFWPGNRRGLVERQYQWQSFGLCHGLLHCYGRSHRTMVSVLHDPLDVCVTWIVCTSSFSKPQCTSSGCSPFPLVNDLVQAFSSLFRYVLIVCI